MNRDKPLGLEVGFPLVLDHFLNHFSKGVGSGVDPLEFLIQVGSGFLWGLWMFRSGFGVIPSFHSGMFLTSFGTGSRFSHKYVRSVGIKEFWGFLNPFEFLHSLP